MTRKLPFTRRERERQTGYGQVKLKVEHYFDQNWFFVRLNGRVSNAAKVDLAIYSD